MSGQADREVADVDHLLNLAQPLGSDLPGLNGDEAAKRGLGAAQFITKNSDEFAAPGAGIDRHSRKAVFARTIASVTLSELVSWTFAMISPFNGERTVRKP